MSNLQMSTINDDSVLIFGPLIGATCTEILSGVFTNFKIFPPNIKRQGMDPRELNNLSKNIGLQSFMELTSLPCLVAHASNLTDILAMYKAPDILTLSHAIVNDLDHYFSNLWLQTDNSVTINRLYIFIKNDWNCGPIQIRYSNSFGNFASVILESHHVIQMNKQYEQMSRIFSESDFKSSVQFMNRLDGYGKHESLTTLGPDQYYNYPGIYRATVLLKHARANSFLPIKATFYAMVLESLLLTRGKPNIKDNVSKRTAKFIADDDSKKKEIISIIRKLYDERSDFVHGTNIDIDVIELGNRLSLVDNFIRRIIRKILSNDNLLELFNKKPQPHFENYFR